MEVDTKFLIHFFTLILWCSPIASIWFQVGSRNGSISLTRKFSLALCDSALILPDEFCIIFLCPPQSRAHLRARCGGLAAGIISLHISHEFHSKGHPVPCRASSGIDKKDNSHVQQSPLHILRDQI